MEKGELQDQQDEAIALDGEAPLDRTASVCSGVVRGLGAVGPGDIQFHLPEEHTRGIQTGRRSSIAGARQNCEEQPLTSASALPRSRARPFQFVLPRRPVARSSKLRSVRVGKIVHELRTDMLRDLLPLTLYGCTNTGHPQCTRSKPTDLGEDFRKAHILLQFACQYATHCVNELDRHSCKLERRSIEYKTKVNRLERHQHLLKEQNTNLQRELEVLNCSLGGMQSLLQELDPGTLAQIEDTLHPNKRDYKKT